jgi:Fe-S cluster assembly ATP-binding protein
MQYPTEVPGVALVDALQAAAAASGRDVADVPARIIAEAERIGFDDRFLTRALNVDLSGGEKKRNETLQLGVLRPKIAILDELDSGLDVDALRACSRRIEEETNERGLGVLAITHYSRLLHELRPDRVHVLVRGVIQRSGGAELATELESTGYATFGVDEPATAGAPAPGAATARAAATDPFADPLA